MGLTFNNLDNEKIEIITHKKFKTAIGNNLAYKDIINNPNEPNKFNR